jgi:hypothetical protein
MNLPLVLQINLAGVVMTGNRYLMRKADEQFWIVCPRCHAAEGKPCIRFSVGGAIIRKDFHKERNRNLNPHGAVNVRKRRKLQ